MRYLVVKKEDSSKEVFIWVKSQNQIPVKQGTTRECSHRDFLRKNNIPFSDVSSVGMIYYNPTTGTHEISVLPWDTPAPAEDNFFVQKECLSFYKKHSDLAAEIQTDWNEYKAWEKRSKELLAQRNS